MKIAIWILKYGLMIFSGVLTVLFFYDLFVARWGDNAIALAILGVVLFEGATAIWDGLYNHHAQHGQRAIAVIGLWFGVLTSAATSCAYLLTATDLLPLTDDGRYTVQLITTIIVIAAFALHLVLSVAYVMADPLQVSHHQLKSDSAGVADRRRTARQKIVDAALTKLDTETDQIAGNISDDLSKHWAGDIITELRGLKRGDAPDAPGAGEPDPGRPRVAANGQTPKATFAAATLDQIVDALQRAAKRDGDAPAPKGKGK